MTEIVPEWDSAAGRGPCVEFQNKFKRIIQDKSQWINSDFHIAATYLARFGIGSGIGNISRSRPELGLLAVVGDVEERFQLEWRLQLA